jgi:hypothetical protein
VTDKEELAVAVGDMRRALKRLEVVRVAIGNAPKELQANHLFDLALAVEHYASNAIESASLAARMIPEHAFRVTSTAFDNPPPATFIVEHRLSPRLQEIADLAKAYLEAQLSVTCHIGVTPK